MKESSFNKLWEEKRQTYAKTAFGLIVTIFLLTIINKVLTPDIEWVNIPVFIIAGIIFIKGLMLLRFKMVHQNQQSRNEEIDDTLELRDLDENTLIQKKTWKDSDLV
jgi:hypothetical protein